MRQAMAEAEVGDDVLDGDPTVRRLEERVAELLGKERALFFPTGTMANQSAVWLLGKRGTEILLDANAHIIHWEFAGAAALAGCQIRPVVPSGLVMSAADLAGAVRPPSAHAPTARAPRAGAPRRRGRRRSSRARSARRAGSGTRRAPRRRRTPSG